MFSELGAGVDSCAAVSVRTGGACVVGGTVECKVVAGGAVTMRLKVVVGERDASLTFVRGILRGLGDVTRVQVCLWCC